MTNRLPDFLIVGAMKCGSTTLYHALTRSPEIFMPQNKEPQFFSKDENYQHGIDSYSRLFADTTPEQICGEASTCYSRHKEYPEAFARIAKHMPQVKIIYIMRNPVPRAVSHYRHRMEERIVYEQQPPLPFDQAIEAYPDILDAGHYAEQLNLAATFFPAEHIHTILFEEFVANPGQILSETASFLGINPKVFENYQIESANPSGSIIAKSKARDTLDHIKGNFVVKTLGKALPKEARSRTRKSMLEWLKRFHVKDSSSVVAREIPAPSNEDLSFLAAYYTEPNLALDASKHCYPTYWQD